MKTQSDPVKINVFHNDRPASWYQRVSWDRRSESCWHRSLDPRPESRKRWKEGSCCLWTLEVFYGKITWFLGGQNLIFSMGCWELMVVFGILHGYTYLWDQLVGYICSHMYSITFQSTGSGSLVLKTKGEEAQPTNQQTNKLWKITQDPKSKVDIQAATWWFQPTPAERYAQVKLDHFPNVGVNIKKYEWNHHLAIIEH